MITRNEWYRKRISRGVWHKVTTKSIISINDFTSLCKMGIKDNNINELDSTINCHLYPEEFCIKCVKILEKAKNEFKTNNN